MCRVRTLDGEAQPLLARCERDLRGSLHRGILEHHHDAVTLAAPVLDGRAAVFDGKARAVAPDEQRVVRQPDDRAFAQHAGHRVSTGSPVSSETMLNTSCELAGARLSEDQPVSWLATGFRYFTHPCGPSR